MAYQRTERVVERLQSNEQALLTAAQELFAKQGYHGTTIKQIANRAGFAVGTFYLYFENKEELFIRLLNELFNRLIEEVRESRQGKVDPIAKLTASMDKAVEIFAQEEELSRILLLQSTGANARFSERLAELHGALAILVKEDLSEALDMGIIDMNKESLSTAAKALVGTFYENILGWLRGREPESLIDILPILTRYNLRGLGISNPDKYLSLGGN